MLTPNTILKSHYRITRELGKGAFGTVYEAVDQNINSIVALKEMSFETNELRNAFEHEARLLANLSHPTLPQVKDYFVEGDRQYLVTELIEGSTLAELLEMRGRPFSTEKVLEWAAQLLDALEYIHNRNILHRDIKPSNIGITDRDKIILLDFGLAKSGSTGPLDFNSVYTPAYAPPEASLGRTTKSSDLYSLGATLYHLVTGTAPLDSKTRSLTLQEKGSDPLPSAHQVNPSIPPSVSALLGRAMAVDSAYRYSSAAEMRDALHHVGKRGEVVQELTIVIGDIAAYSALSMEIGQLSVTTLMREFTARVTNLSKINNGSIVKFIGDGFFAIFNNPSDAITFAIALQRSLSEAPIGHDSRALQVRIGIHTGKISQIDTEYGKDYVGSGISLAARISQVCPPNQVAISDRTHRLLTDRDADEFSVSKQVELKHIGETTVWITGINLG
jgi:serine/threonine protein kinase